MAFSATLETSRRRWWLRWIKKEEISRAHSRCTHILTHTRIRWCSVEKILFPRGMKALLSRPALFDISDQVLLFSTLHSFSLLVFVSYSCLLLLYEFIKFGGSSNFPIENMQTTNVEYMHCIIAILSASSTKVSTKWIHNIPSTPSCFLLRPLQPPLIFVSFFSLRLVLFCFVNWSNNRLRYLPGPR